MARGLSHTAKRRVGVPWAVLREKVPVGQTNQPVNSCLQPVGYKHGTDPF